MDNIQPVLNEMVMKNPRTWIIAVSVLLLGLAGLVFFAEPAHELAVDADAACVNQCGNGTCEEMVCMAVGCPCAETAESCTADCAIPR